MLVYSCHRMSTTSSSRPFLRNDWMFGLPQLVKAALVSNVNVELFNALHYHMVNSRLLTKDLKNGMVVTSMYNDLGLHINHYSNGVSSLTALGWGARDQQRGFICQSRFLQFL